MRIEIKHKTGCRPDSKVITFHQVRKNPRVELDALYLIVACVSCGEFKQESAQLVHADDSPLELIESWHK